MFDWTTNSLFLHSKKDKKPDIDPYDLAKIDLGKLIERNERIRNKGRNKANKTLIDNDVFELAKLKKQSKKDLLTG